MVGLDYCLTTLAKLRGTRDPEPMAAAARDCQQKMQELGITLPEFMLVALGVMLRAPEKVKADAVS